jgi:hypothetical protein
VLKIGLGIEIEGILVFTLEALDDDYNPDGEG